MSLYCSVFGRRFEVSKKVTHHVKEYKCSHCSKELTTNGNGNLIELTSKYKEINSTLIHIHLKRMNKLCDKNILAPYKLTV